MIALRRWSAVLMFCVYSALLSADDESARQLLDKMSHSFRELNYQGSFSFQQGDQTESLRIAHAIIDGQEYERLEYMDGDQREIIRQGHDPDCIHPGHQLVRFYQQRQGLKQYAHKQADIEEYYQFRLLDKGRIAGREVFHLDVSPRDLHRFGYRLALDKDTGLLLRSELTNPDGAVLERFQFVEITIGAEMDRDDFSAAEHSYQAEHIAPVVDGDKAAVIADKSWQVNWLPRGFTAAVANEKFSSNDMATFTDGLTVFSVFLETNIDPAAMAKGVEGSARRGATIAYSRALLLAGRPHRVTVVGEIPAQTARQIAQSVVLVSQ
jgi:sigma-E factor negative regulatory protein RseB